MFRWTSGGRRSALAAGWVALLLFRIYFGLHAPPVVVPEDDKQIYLIGLKSYTTQTWPYYGTDLSTGDDGDYRGQMAGALQGLLVAVPLFIWPAPAAPYVFLNLLTLVAITWFTWYCGKRLPDLPRWWMLLWMAVMPWNLHFSTTMINQSYSAIGGVLFAVGWLESMPRSRVGAVSVGWANALMACGLLWIAQLHMSYVMFGPLLAYSWFEQWRGGTLKSAVLGTLAGSVPMLALLVPTYVVYGVRTVQDLEGHAQTFNPINMARVPEVLARFLSYASFELPRFLGPGRARVAYLLDPVWIAPLGFFLWGLGVLQPFALIALAFVRRHPRPEWPVIRNLTLGVCALIWVLFWFSMRPPASYRYSEILPIVMLYSFYAWDYLAQRRAWRVAGVACLAIAVTFQVAYAWKSDRDGVSFYAQSREKIARAIAQRDYHQLGERRVTSIY